MSTFWSRQLAGCVGLCKGVGQDFGRALDLMLFHDQRGHKADAVSILATFPCQQPCVECATPNLLGSLGICERKNPERANPAQSGDFGM